MSDSPWIMQELFGTAETRNESVNNYNSRVANPTASTPATFGDLNWEYSENGPADPRPEANVCTFMGPGKTSFYGTTERFVNAFQIKVALDTMRKHGYRCELPPKGWEFDFSECEDEDKDDKKDNKLRAELEYLRENYFEKHEVLGEDADNPAFVMTVSCDWIYIRCATKEAEEFVTKHLLAHDSEEHYALSKLPHDEGTATIDASNDVTIAWRTGSGKSPDSPGTLFELKKGNQTVAKALCSYSNSAMGNAGPTIESFEVAREWRGHGYGKRLLNGMTAFLKEEIFLNAVVREDAKFNVTYCTNRHAYEWFVSQGFQDLSGIGEELGKYLCS